MTGSFDAHLNSPFAWYMAFEQSLLGQPQFIEVDFCKSLRRMLQVLPSFLSFLNLDDHTKRSGLSGPSLELSRHLGDQAGPRGSSKPTSAVHTPAYFRKLEQWLLVVDPYKLHE